MKTRDQFGDTGRPKAGQRMNEYFVPGDDIDREVITADISRYLGNDATLRPGIYENPITRKVEQGYFIETFRDMTASIVADLKGDSERWEVEKRTMGFGFGGRPSRDIEYRNSTTHYSRQYYGPNFTDPGLTTRPTDSFDEGNSSGQQTSPNALPVVEHLPPNRKDLPLLLSGTFCRTCADFGAGANVIDAKFVRKLGLAIDSETTCPAFELPTFKRLLRPFGRVSITCEFPQEPLSRVSEVFFVVENFVHNVVMGREFLRKTQTLDKFPNRLIDRPLQVHDVPVVALLGGQDEGLKFWLDGEELISIPDTGSEINVMSLSFAKQRGFPITKDPAHQVRFADSSVQNVEGRVSVPVSFGNGAPPRLLLKLVDLTNYSPADVREPDPTGAIGYGFTDSILAEFYVLEGLKVEIVFGEDLLAVVNAFVRHSTDFNELPGPLADNPSLATMGLVKKAGKLFCSAIGKQNSRTKDLELFLERERDIADSRELDRYEEEKSRIENLAGEEKARAERRNERKRREYNDRRRRLAGSI